uniref:Uncharacterized protein n=1 Tax=Parascaris equorum TaxID=6256 RepID=A0A914R7F6_PAREQ
MGLPPSTSAVVSCRVVRAAQLSFTIAVRPYKPKQFSSSNALILMGDEGWMLNDIAGHELYLQSVEQQGLYPVTSRMRPLAELDAEEFCIVDEV